jgi:hypothetical protein
VNNTNQTVQSDSPDFIRLIPAIQIVITVILLLPFSNSVTVIINGNLTSSGDKSSEEYRQLSLKRLRDGTVILVIGLILIAMLHALTFH